MLLSSNSRNFEYEQKPYEFSVELSDQTLRVVLKNSSCHQILDKVFVKQTIPSQLKHEIKSVEDFYKFFQNPENYCIDVPEKKIKMYTKNKNKEYTVEIDLIEIKTEESDEYRSIIIDHLPIEEEEMNTSDHEKRISELEKLVIGLINSRRSQWIKLQQDIQKDQFLRKSQFVDFAKDLIKEEQKKSNEFYLKKSTRETAELRQEIEDRSVSLEERMSENKKILLHLKDNYTKVAKDLSEQVEKWKQKCEELQAQSLIKNSRIKKLEDELETLKGQTSLRNEILSGYNPRKRFFSDYSYEPAVSDGKKPAILKDQRIKTLPQGHLFDQDSEFLKLFQVTQNLIKYVGEDRIGTQILLQRVLDFQRVERFRIKVVNSQQCFVKFGIIDRSYIKERSSWSKKSPRCILYSGTSGDIYEGGKFLKSQGLGFQKGKIVQMIVNLKFGMIQWVCGDYWAEIFSEQMKQKGVRWAVVIQMSQNGDIIQLIE